MAFFIPVPASSFSIPHRSQVVANFYAHTNPESHPFPQPVELRSSMSEDEWHARTLAIWTHFARYTWARVLRAYLVLALLLSLVGPISANLVVHRILYNGVEPISLNSSDDEIRERLSLIRRGHMINFIVVCLIFVILWAPYLSYKSLGRRRLAALLRSFNQADAAKGNMQALNWICSRTSTFQSNGTVVIELPVAFVSANQPSLFHQAAYLPDYIQKPAAPQAPPMYTHATAQKGPGLAGATHADVAHKA
ncbi:hypothetical protein PTTG_04656 [Puccinia triticina 1-1 BBBD Race 1]|uniref:Uncharacterized protein n=2 Tax=Puccinia triticina TaxID=208348 RepID=A0A180G5M6_PUCT1|nr:uncharacterized protein PtA15_14A123 [Puccinia triticina]OAV87163.1 hypothetical protein PTTG_04656 [Puccinia triticina 1-1 BBBD Race 1]WAQ91241.1 hypothetical protein PtA15_14A123 [Puccinia triticina]WAR62043.1 hypothetical protein PtB15_14B137 [Puccinia triticina]